MVIKCRVLIADGVRDSRGDSVEASNVEVLDERVPVTVGFDPERQVGWARLFWQDKEVWAEFAIPDDVATSMAGLWFPAVGAKVVGTVPGRPQPQCFFKYELNAIGLCDSGNDDKRIEPVKLG